MMIWDYNGYNYPEEKHQNKVLLFNKLIYQKYGHITLLLSNL